MKRIVFFLVIILQFQISMQGQDSSFIYLGYDTSYVKSYRDKLIITIVSSSNSNTISVNDSLGEQVSFSTNVPTSFGLAVDYKWLTAEYTTSFGRVGPEQYGYTSLRSIGFGLTGRKLWFRNFYQKTKGYYLSTPEYFFPEFNPQLDDYPHRDDVTSSIYFANLNYGFNYKRFSNMAALWQIEKQKKSAGSFTAGLSFAYITYGADSSLVPKKYQDYFQSKEFATGYFFTMFGVNGGYMHTFSFGKQHGLFLSLAFVPGLSFQSGKLFAENGPLAPREHGLGAHVEGRLITGYNGDQWYTAMSLVGYSIFSDFKDRNPSSQGYSFFRFVVGYKIKLKESKSPFLKKIGL